MTIIGIIVLILLTHSILRIVLTLTETKINVYTVTAMVSIQIGRSVEIYDSNIEASCK